MERMIVIIVDQSTFGEGITSSLHCGKQQKTRSTLVYRLITKQPLNQKLSQRPYPQNE